MTKDVLVITGSCIDCEHPYSARSMPGLLDSAVDHDVRKHAERIRGLPPGSSPALRARVSTKTVRIETRVRAS